MQAFIVVGMNDEPGFDGAAERWEAFAETVERISVLNTPDLRLGPNCWLLALNTNLHLFSQILRLSAQSKLPVRVSFSEKSLEWCSWVSGN